MNAPMALVLLAGAVTASFAAHADPVIPNDDYALYDQVVIKKFLTSDTSLVVIERMTVPRLSPQQDGPLTIKLVRELGVFDGALPPELVRDFVAVNQEPARLEARFQFGVRYRFVIGHSLEEPEVSLAYPVKGTPVVPAQLSPVFGRLAFSRVGRTLRNDQALLYVEQHRPDGAGAGFFVWFRRQGREWTLFDTDVLWTIGDEGEPEGGPPLAP